MVKLYCRIILSLIFLTVWGVGLYGQESRLSVRADHKSPADFFSELSLQSGINIIYSDNIIEKLPPITLSLKGVSVDQIMTEVLQGSQVGFKYIDQQIIL